jgi:hypothetical protein
MIVTAIALCLAIHGSAPDPCWDLPDDDTAVACLVGKYGPEEMLPGESGRSWCDRQRKLWAGMGGETMECGVDGQDYPPALGAP